MQVLIIMFPCNMSQIRVFAENLVGLDFLYISCIKPIPTHENVCAVIFLGLGWPWVGEFVGFIILFICFPTQHNLVNRKHPTILRWGTFREYYPWFDAGENEACRFIYPIVRIGCMITFNPTGHYVSGQSGICHHGWDHHLLDTMVHKGHYCVPDENHYSNPNRNPNANGWSTIVLLCGVSHLCTQQCASSIISFE